MYKSLQKCEVSWSSTSTGVQTERNIKFEIHVLYKEMYDRRTHSAIHFLVKISSFVSLCFLEFEADLYETSQFF